MSRWLIGFSIAALAAVGGIVTYAGGWFSGDPAETSEGVTPGVETPPTPSPIQDIAAEPASPEAADARQNPFRLASANGPPPTDAAPIDPASQPPHLPPFSPLPSPDASPVAPPNEAVAYAAQRPPSDEGPAAESGRMTPSPYGPAFAPTTPIERPEDGLPPRPLPSDPPPPVAGPAVSAGEVEPYARLPHESAGGSLALPVEVDAAPSADPPPPTTEPTAEPTTEPARPAPAEVPLSPESSPPGYPELPPPVTSPADDFNPGDEPALPTPAEVAPMEVDAGPRFPLDQPEPPPAALSAAPLDPPRRPASGAIETAGSAGQGQPGIKTLDGLQTPTLAIEKFAPREIQIGKAATFEIKVQNVGKAPAHAVTLLDVIPAGTRLVATNPPARETAAGELAWQWEKLGPGDAVAVSIEVLPVEEGEIGSVARVQFEAEASVRTVATRPLLTIEHTVPEQVLAGQNVPVRIKIANPGTGAAAGVVLQTDIPQGLSHPAGKQLEYEVGVIKPGETRELELTLTAVVAGPVETRLVATADANLRVEDRQSLEVIAPRLQVAVDGPRRRFLGRRAVYELSVANPGTAPARDIELVAYLPRSFQFQGTNNSGLYDEKSHAVYWSLEELPPGKLGSVQLEAVPIEMGEARLRIEGKGAGDLKDDAEQMIAVEGIASISFTVADKADPIEIGEETSYEVQVVNDGTKDATDIRVVALLPPGLKPLGGDGPVRAEVVGQQISFAPIAELKPGAQIGLRIRASGQVAGDQRAAVQVSCAELDKPITKEEGTRVYSDR